MPPVPDDLVEPDRLPGLPHPREHGVLFGHERAESAFLDALRTGRLHHAWLIGGPQGIGKATLAYRVARAVLAVDGKAASTTIPVDAVRRATALFGSTAANGGYRICIVDSAEDLTPASANAILKMIEEPPPRSLILVVAHQPQRVLPTVRSRCRRLALAPLEQPD